MIADTGDDREFVAELIATFIETAPDMLTEIRTASDSGDLEVLRRAAHTLKSNSASLGATRLADASAAIEHHAHDGQPAADPDHIALAAEYERVRDALLARYPEAS